MSSEPLSVETGDLRAFSRAHADVATDIARAAERAPDAAGVASTHGTIGFGMQAALKELLGARLGSLQTTAGSGDAIAEMLRTAARTYDGVDDDGAQRIRAAWGDGLDFPFPDVTTVPVPDAPAPLPVPGGRLR
ncbi:ESX-1 secretion-associated protein [Mycolicibacterium arseniciresistens]|uniref:ESX-1 secretion-associated protein n=1 Tax=Mycolicibacterium arseniciresistens TaxID=3062257 RepID=A0ABT8UQZ3_9MYCO|nr:ESX-1 secretion-associated protein [Mycolicibacterium arseniciresistens]MDO3640222.1 ESX-1 secretion-associated protein [Mycolicibacterium arseniciresistens]